MLLVARCGNSAGGMARNIYAAAAPAAATAALRRAAATPRHLPLPGTSSVKQTAHLTHHRGAHSAARIVAAIWLLAAAASFIERRENRKGGWKPGCCRVRRNAQATQKHAQRAALSPQRCAARVKARGAAAWRKTWCSASALSGAYNENRRRRRREQAVIGPAASARIKKKAARRGWHRAASRLPRNAASRKTGVSALTSSGIERAAKSRKACALPPASRCARYALACRCARHYLLSRSRAAAAWRGVAIGNNRRARQAEEEAGQIMKAENERVGRENNARTMPAFAHRRGAQRGWRFASAARRTATRYNQRRGCVTARTASGGAGAPRRSAWLAAARAASPAQRVWA